MISITTLMNVLTGSSFIIQFNLIRYKYKIYDESKSQETLLVDADNAFNSLNRKAALNNIQYACPEFSTYLIHTYIEPSNPFVSGSNDLLLSDEGTKQGDNAAMGFYAISLFNNSICERSIKTRRLTKTNVVC